MSTMKGVMLLFLLALASSTAQAFESFNWVLCNTAKAHLQGSAWPSTYYIATSGSDSNTGTIDSPWATFTRAQQQILCINTSTTSDIFIYLRAGQYFQEQTIQFDTTNSGWNGFTVHYASYPGETPIIHSGVAVTGWAQVSGSTSIWFATIPSSVTDTRQVYINGERMNNTNTGAGIPGTVTITETGYTTTDPLTWAFDSHQGFRDIEFLYTGVGSSWTECRARVESVVALPGGGGVNITMQQPGYYLARNRYYGQEVTSPASISNAFALLSASTPGQYYFNSGTGIIYYVPRPQDNMATATVIVPSSNLVTILALNGDRTAEPTINPVHHLSFEGLTFSYVGWLEPNQGLGYVDMQSGWRVLPNTTGDDDTWIPIPGHVQFHTVQNASVINCTFTHLGATALLVDDGSQSIILSGNYFHDVSAGGIYVGQINDDNMTDATRFNAHMLITENFFDNIPVEFRDAAAFCAGFLVNMTLSQNTIINCSNTGISNGWGWSRDQATNAGWNKIIGNYVFGSNWLLVDGGSIYSLGPQPESLMARNYVSHQRQLYGALYVDEGSGYWHITENVVHSVPEWFHAWIATVHDIVVDNCWTDQTYQINHGTNVTEINITYVTPGDPFPDAAVAIMNASGISSQLGPKD